MKVVKEWTLEETQQIYECAGYPRRVVDKGGVMEVQWQYPPCTWYPEDNPEAAAPFLVAVNAHVADPYTLTIKLRLPPPGTQIPADGWTVLESEDTRLYYNAHGRLCMKRYQDTPTQAPVAAVDLLAIPDQLPLAPQAIAPYEVKR